MDKILISKIERYHGWDICEHQKIRNYCPECSLDVPAIIRQAEMPDLKRIGQLGLALTNSPDSSKI